MRCPKLEEEKEGIKMPNKTSPGPALPLIYPSPRLKQVIEVAAGKG